MAEPTKQPPLSQSPFWQLVQRKYNSIKAKRAARYRFKPKKKKLHITIFLFIRPVLAVAAACAVYCYAQPIVLEFIEAEQGSRAISKGRVLLRGAQQVATEQLIGGAGWEETEEYLCHGGNLSEIAAAGIFSVTPVEITSASLDDGGRIKVMSCVVEYDYARYRIDMDLTSDRYDSELLERLERPEEQQGLGFFMNHNKKA